MIGSLFLSFSESDQEMPWMSLVCFQSCRDGVSCGTKTELSNAATAYRLDANGYQVSGVWWANQRAQEFNFCTGQDLLVIPVLTLRQISIILERRRVCRISQYI